MPVIGIDVSFVDDYPPDPTSAMDYLIFTVLIGYTVILISACFFLLRLKKTYEPLMFKNVPKIVWMIIFGIIHSWAVFISNEHLNAFNDLRFVDCAFWNFWLQYLIGLGGWFVILVRRILVYGRIFYKEFYTMNNTQKGLFEWTLTGVFIVPIFFICIGVSVFSGSYYDVDDETCFTHLPWKILTLLWILICCVTLLLMNRIIISSMNRNSYFSEYRPINAILVVGSLVIMIKVPIHFFGLVGHIWGRTIDTSAIIFLHIFSFCCLISYTTWKAITRDQVYAENHKSSYRHLYPELESIKPLISDPVVLDDFLKFCSVQGNLRRIVHQKLSRNILAINMCNAYKKMVEWKTMESPIVNAFTICDQYIHIDGQFYCGLDERFANAIKRSAHLSPDNLFEPALFELLCLLDDNWGKDYIKKKCSEGIMSGEASLRQMRQIEMEELGDPDINDSEILLNKK